MCMFIYGIILECNLYISMIHLSHQDFGWIFIEVNHVLEDVKSHNKIKCPKGRELVQESFFNHISETEVMILPHIKTMLKYVCVDVFRKG